VLEFIDPNWVKKERENPLLVKHYIQRSGYLGEAEGKTIAFFSI